MSDPSRWLPVRLRNAESIGYLNEQFAKGWYVMDLGLSDLPFLYFEVPLDPGKKRPKIAPELKHISVMRMPRKGSTPVPVGGLKDAMPVLVLTKGEEKGRQMAVAVVRDESGYIDMTSDRTDVRKWRHLLTCPMEEEGYVVIYERRATFG
jgi:hypothetical protein